MTKRFFIVTIILAIAVSFLPASIKLLITRYPRIVLLLPLDGIDNFLSNIRSQQTAYQNLAELTTQLTLENTQLKAKIQKDDFLATLKNPDLVHANIIARDNEVGIRFLTIDKGLRNNIKIDMPVLTAYGVVGKIIESADNHSIVETALSPSLKISGLNLRTNVSGIIEYSYFDKLRFKYAFAESDIQTNDTIITSGLGGIFPRGIVIGIVLNVKIDPTRFFQYVDVNPLVNFNGIEDVFILIKPVSFAAEPSPKFTRSRNLYDLKIETPTAPRIR
ncbi:MAG: rod shape-determining protein MreC [Candidatus Latescibacteria bacterium]|nr:rod shape-determining protein MreC [Candidatus Latescibacterota bacterium]